MKTNLKGRKLRVIVLLAALVVSLMTITGKARSQTDTVTVPDYFEGGEGTLNAAVTAAINDSTLSNKVFKLKAFGYYILTGTITVPAGERLTIVAPEPRTTQQTAPPQIVWSTAAETTYYNFRCFGDITLKNIWLLYATPAGYQVGSSLKIEDSPDTINGQHGTFEGCLFDYSPVGADASGAVSVTSRHFRGMFTNCYFRNCIDQHFRYYGRAVSFPFMSTGWHIDTLSFVNCTFANIGFVYMQENGEYGDVVRFNHCTFLNTVMYTLESGWWHWLSVTNSVFVNAFMYGDFPALHIAGGEQPDGGTICIDSVARFGFPVPFTDTQRHILFANSSYVIQNWLRQHMTNADPIWYPDTTIPVEARKPHPQPMMNQRTLAFFDTVINGTKIFPYITRANLYDSTDPGFVLPATNEFAIKRFLTKKWTNSEDTNWAFQPQASVNQVWPLPENLAYVNAALLTAGMGGFPIGDLYHWFPDRYAQWKLQERAENTRISIWLESGRDTSVVSVKEHPLIAGRYALEQNYPNPFNPTTRINYSLPQKGYVSLKVYNLLGQEVAKLFAGVQEPGNHSATFDGAGHASGVYFYRLATDDFTQTKRFVLLK